MCNRQCIILYYIILYYIILYYIVTLIIVSNLMMAKSEMAETCSSYVMYNYKYSFVMTAMSMRNSFLVQMEIFE